ncbi:MAG: hypothetical protein MAG431_01332 [Chloroflexi bacterium]|nr:hypothetical protein [Chloroflexota bacterium]
MKLDLLAPFESFPYFTIEGFKQSLDIGEDNAQKIRQMLSRWAKRGHILRLKRGIYMTRRFYELHRSDVGLAPTVSAIILPQSYLSLEYVLQKDSILTEVTYPVTAMTTKNTRTIENPLGTFDYRHIHSRFYRGFTQKEYHGILYHEASVAKALFDYLYLRPLPRKLRAHMDNLAEDLRLKIEGISSGDREEFAAYIDLSDSEKMSFILENFQRTAWQH